MFDREFKRKEPKWFKSMWILQRLYFLFYPIYKRKFGKMTGI